MDRIVVQGGPRLEGEVRASGSKNATLALMAAALLAEGETRIANAPRVRDVDAMLELLRALGASADWVPDAVQTLAIDATNITSPEAPYDIVRKMRASFMVLGPLVGRCGLARVSEPGGCAIGVRPVDQHMKGLAALGAKIDLDHGTVEARAQRLVGGRVVFDLVSVNGTQNVMMAAALAEGVTDIENAAREPEVVELGEFLARMGVRLEGAGSDHIRVYGGGGLAGVEHVVSGDRIEAGTLLAAGVVTCGDVTVTGVVPQHMDAVLDKLREAGAEVETSHDRVRVCAAVPLRGVDVATAPYPGVPTDMQAQLMAALVTADGSSVVTETIFENRFMHVPELQRMGADISVQGRSAHVRGVPRLSGAQVMATDLRASASLLVAALPAEGSTTVNRVYHIDRGYERIEEKLCSLGAEIRRES